MSLSKRPCQSMLIYDKNSATSTTPFIETDLISKNSLSRTSESHKQSSQIIQLVDSQRQQSTDGFHEEKRQVQDHLKIISKVTTKNKRKNVNRKKKSSEEIQNNCEDDWVCPVAVALRRAGYNVPLRPSKSWLARDREKQALLREQQTLSKEM